MQHPIRWSVIALGICLAAGCGVQADAHACGLDGIPSLSVNGALAQRMTSKPSRAILAHWAPFFFPGPYRQQTNLKLQENLAELQRSLPAQAFGHPWRWTLGDGTTTTGTVIQHAYRRAGEYRITVSAYYSSYKSWFQFDEALIVVR